MLIFFIFNGFPKDKKKWLKNLVKKYSAIVNAINETYKIDFSLVVTPYLCC